MMALDRAPVGAARATWRVTVRGVVQGVGFRPFVHRLATRASLDGWVRNDAGTVEIAVTGTPGDLGTFVDALRAEAPPRSRIDDLIVRDGAPDPGTGFRIADSEDDDHARLLIPPDIATCADCERELYDPADRRHGYPFITCTNCGPRQSVILGMPYDRERTTMRAFAQCPRCEREYRAPGDRRFHSQSNACPQCGPSAVLYVVGDPTAPSEAPIPAAARLLRAGGIVAVKGIGGYHLAVDATSERAVARLRERKGREGKPLAVMVRDLAAARDIASLSAADEDWLAAPQRPIVVLRQRASGGLAPSVSEGLGTVGIMLAYSPLHMLLLDAVAGPLVMTSGNPANVPLARTLAEARATLDRIADAFLDHDRDIAVPIDDSVLRVVDDAPVLLRRARGFAPLPVPLPIPATVPLVAVGAHLKNTFTLARGGDAYVSQHIGDLETLETADHWERCLASMSVMLRISPRLAVHDLHPEYLSTRLAGRLGLPGTMTVQHHHAHVAAVAAEHGVTLPVLGIAFDGTGYGPDGAVWGGEFLVADLASYRRVGQLRYAPLPGGDAASRQGWRAAVGYAHLAPQLRDTIGDRLDAPRAAWNIARRQCATGVNAPLASSVGRLFDAAAAILGVCSHSRFEGEAAMLLESVADRIDAEPYDTPVYRDGSHWILDPVPLLTELARRSARGEDRGILAAAFHESIAGAAAKLAGLVARDEVLDRVVLAGGVFQNARLLRALRLRLEDQGLEVLSARALPANDGAISYGQAAVAAARLALRGAGR